MLFLCFLPESAAILFMAVSFFMPVSADIDFIDVSFFMPVSAVGAGAIAGAGAAVDVESAPCVPVSFALHATATSVNAAATRARRFVYTIS